MFFFPSIYVNRMKLKLTGDFPPGVIKRKVLYFANNKLGLILKLLYILHDIMWK